MTRTLGVGQGFFFFWGGRHAQDEDTQGRQETLSRHGQGQTGTPPGRKEAPQWSQDRQAQTAPAQPPGRDRPAAREVRQDYGWGIVRSQWSVVRSEPGPLLLLTTD